MHRGSHSAGATSSLGDTEAMASKTLEGGNRLFVSASCSGVKRHKIFDAIFCRNLVRGSRRPRHASKAQAPGIGCLWLLLARARPISF